MVDFFKQTNIFLNDYSNIIAIFGIIVAIIGIIVGNIGNKQLKRVKIIKDVGVYQEKCTNYYGANKEEVKQISKNITKKEVENIPRIYTGKEPPENPREGDVWISD